MKRTQGQRILHLRSSPLVLKQASQSSGNSRQRPNLRFQPDLRVEAQMTALGTPLGRRWGRHLHRYTSSESLPPRSCAPVQQELGGVEHAEALLYRLLPATEACRELERACSHRSEERRVGKERR